MSKTPGIIDPHKNDPEDLFVGWAKAPRADRRFLLAALPLGLAGAAGVSWLSASSLDDPGAGAWLTGATHEITGRLLAHPYPMVLIPDENAPYGLRTVLVVTEGKCTSSLKLAAQDGNTYIAKGVLIQRKDRQMLEVPPLLDNWLMPVSTSNLPVPQRPEPEIIGDATLRGTIMDSKCFFGVMRPGRGKTHKACAALCIRGGIPPSFWVRMKDGSEQVLLMTDANGGPMPMDILPLVADPVSASGQIVRVGNLLQFRADADAYKRI